MRGRSRRKGEEGYILIYLMFLVAMLAFSLITVLPRLDSERKRDREEEMVHRGVQYSRAIRRYFRKNGGYPPTIEALESSSNIRYLRKRYKDPITGKDFKILHQTDVKFTFGNGILGAQNLGQPIAGTTSIGPAQDPNAANNGQPPATGTGTGTDPNNPNNNNSSQSASTDPSSSSPFVTADGKPGDPTAGAGPLVGVASLSTAESIRVYNKKNHYNEWQFVYDPSSDRGALIVGPYQPMLQSLMQGQNVNLNGFGGIGQGGGTMPGVVTPGTVAPRP